MVCFLNIFSLYDCFQFIETSVLVLRLAGFLFFLLNPTIYEFTVKKHINHILHSLQSKSEPFVGPLLG